MLFFFLGKMQLHADNRIELTDFNSMADFILLPLQRIKLNIHLIFGIDNMKKIVVMGMALCTALAFSSCKSSESAYKKAYEKAKQQELAEASSAAEAPVEAPAVEAAPAPAPVVSTAPVREEKVELVSGDGLKAYSVVCGSFGVKANADGLKSKLDGDGYNAKVVYNAERNMYRVVVESFDTRDEAARARDAFKAKYPNREDFQGSWLLYRVY